MFSVTSPIPFLLILLHFVCLSNACDRQLDTRWEPMLPDFASIVFPALHIEATINHPAMFKVFRRAQGESTWAPKRRLPLRKGVADIALRAHVSQDINNRFMDQLATCTHEKPLRELFETVSSRPKQKDKRRVRALDLIGKDRALLQAISDPAFTLSGFTNKALRKKLQGQLGYTGRSMKSFVLYDTFF